MKQIKGVLRFDVLDFSGWCFDMGYQRIYVQTGMVMSVKLTDRFEQVELTETPDNGLSLILDDKKKAVQRLNPLEKGRRYLARMPKDVVDEIISSAAIQNMELERLNEETPTNRDELEDALPF